VEVSLKFLNLEQVQEKIGVKRTMVYKLINQGFIPKPKKIGTRNIWLESEIESAMKKIFEVSLEKTAKGVVTD
jgi:prophage regulatory protein